MGKLDNRVAGSRVRPGARVAQLAAWQRRRDDSRHITGTQLRIDAGGSVKSDPWNG